MSANPFDLILEKIDQLENRLVESGKITPAEVIDRKELLKRLKITSPTVIRWERKGVIPSFKIGSHVRYDWVKVIQALEKN